jgi:hypothetical protein
MALGDIWQLRGGKPQSVTTSVRNAVHQHHGVAFMRQNGRPIPFTDYGSGVGVDSPMSGEFFPTRDGRFVKIELFYPRLRDAMFKVLKCAPTQRAVEAAIMQWDGEALELAIREEAGAIGMIRTAAEWRNHPVGQRLAAKPVIEVQKIGDSDPVPLPKGCDKKPLSGIRVLDCTHVIGGPVTARTLAEFGADVLHLSRRVGSVGLLRYRRSRRRANHAVASDFCRLPRSLLRRRRCCGSTTSPSDRRR